jgi:hypothetical protein
MTEITFPDGMKWIGKAAFYGSYHLLRATFPASMKTVGRQAFQDCYKLMEIYKAEGSSITFGEWCFRNAPVWKTHQTLEEESMVRREPDPKDMRSVRVYLTEKGRAVDEEFREKLRETDRLLMRNIGEEDEETLIRLLMAVRENIRPENPRKEK